STNEPRTEATQASPPPAPPPLRATNPFLRVDPQPSSAPSPPPQTPTVPAPPPPPPPPPTVTTRPPSSQRCPPDRCFLDGRCVIPGGPLVSPRAPPGAIAGICGHGGDCFPCRCASPFTSIATPRGDVPIATIRKGDEVYSVHRGMIAVV